jgi:hypothetical protein
MAVRPHAASDVAEATTAAKGTSLDCRAMNASSGIAHLCVADSFLPLGADYAITAQTTGQFS